MPLNKDGKSFRMTTWEGHVTAWQNCQRCPLGKQRDRICLARGDLPADIVFCGEAPGASEDATGLVFYGPAGKLLDNPGTVDKPGIVQKAGLREAGLALVFTNLVCCYPRAAKERGDNEPESAEIEACEPRLIEFINIAQPRLLVTVGRLAEQWIDPEHIRHVNIIHPAALLKDGLPMVVKQNRMDEAIVELRTEAAILTHSVRGKWKRWENGSHASKQKNQGLFRNPSPRIKARRRRPDPLPDPVTPLKCERCNGTGLVNVTVPLVRTVRSAVCKGFGVNIEETMAEICASVDRGYGKYATTADSCECPDHKYRGRICKHMLKVREGHGGDLK